MPSSTSSPSQVLTNASAPPSRIAGKIPRPSSAVSKTRVDAVGNRVARRLRQALAARQHDVRAEAAHELLVGRGRVGQHAKPCPLRERDRVGGEQARAARDEQRRPAREVEKLEADAAPSGRSSAASTPARTWRPRGAGRRTPPARRAAATARRLRDVAARPTAITSSPTASRRRPDRPTPPCRRRPSPAPTAAAHPGFRARGTRCRTGARRQPSPRAEPRPRPGSRDVALDDAHDLRPAGLRDRDR